MPRNAHSVLCLLVCTALLWGAWQISSAVNQPPDRQTESPSASDDAGGDRAVGNSSARRPSAPPELQFWPFGRARRAPAPNPNANPAANPGSNSAANSGAAPRHSLGQKSGQTLGQKSGQTLGQKSGQVPRQPAGPSVRAVAAQPPVVLPPEPMPQIRVGLLAEPRKSVAIEISQPFTVKALGSDKVLHRADRLAATTVSATPRGLKLGTREFSASQLEIVPTQSPAVWVEGHQYRGAIRLLRQGKSQVTAINVLPLEDYLASVVNGEMPAAFPDEARKAQAIVARTYALYQMAQAEKGSTADLFASVRSQKYPGYQYRDHGKLLAGESEASRKIVAATRGQVCQYRGQEFCTYYCAVCGGSTVRGKETFADAAPPLVSVPCDFCQEARLYRWTAEISKADLQHDLGPWLKEHGQSGGTVQSLTPVRSLPAGKTLPEFDLRTGRQTLRITGTELRQYLGSHGLYSPRFSVKDQGQKIEISGRGHGHGVGLCQWGARGQALAGRDCGQIVQHYYPGCTLVTRTWK